MREIRPTIKVLKSLPRDTFPDPTAHDLARAGDYDDLCLYGISHPLLDDARSYFDRGALPELMQSATKKAKRPIYEVRDRQGAAWRGAVILDNGDPWLVYADRHDRYLRHAATAVSSLDGAPRQGDYVIREAEEAEVELRSWQVQVLTNVLNALATAAATPDAIPVALPDRRSTAPEQGTITIQIDNDAPADDVALAHTTYGWTTLRMSIRTAGNRSDLVAELIATCVPFLQPDPARREEIYTQDGALEILFDIPHSRIAQITATHANKAAPVVMHVDHPTHLHYVEKAVLAEGFVTGRAVRGACGIWFVPLHDEATVDLPVCPACEEDEPIAQALLDLIRDAGQ